MTAITAREQGVAPFTVVVRDHLGRIVRAEPIMFIPSRNFPNLTRVMVRTGRVQP